MDMKIRCFLQIFMHLRERLIDQDKLEDAYGLYTDALEAAAERVK